MRVPSGDPFGNAGDTRGDVVATAGAFLWRSDLRAGVTSDCVEAFLVCVDGAFPFGTDAGPEPLRTSRLTPVFGVPFVCVALVGRGVRFTGSGVGGAVSLFTRDDFRTPFSNTVVGPSATNDLQGGDTARDAERRRVLSSSFRRLAGLSMTPPSCPFTGADSSSSLMTDAPSRWMPSPLCVLSDAVGVLVKSRGGMGSMSRSAALTSSIQEGRRGGLGSLETTRRAAKSTYISSNPGSQESLTRAEDGDVVRFWFRVRVGQMQCDVE